MQVLVASICEPILLPDRTVCSLLNGFLRFCIPFLLKPILKFRAIILHVSSLFTEKTLNFLLDITLRWYLDFALLICLRFFSFDSFVLPASSSQKCTLTLFHHKPFFFLNTHGH
ncbi:pre-mRNA-splicing factor cwc25 [Trifolium repens]|nr:pre-mRNA-splicing factor cwc25 [Trifolium repens]